MKHPSKWDFDLVIRDKKQLKHAYYELQYVC